jgi:hypothetical protein
MPQQPQQLSSLIVVFHLALDCSAGKVGTAMESRMEHPSGDSGMKRFEKSRAFPA